MPTQVDSEPIVYEAVVTEARIEVITWQQEFAKLPLELQATSLCESDTDGDSVPNPEAQNPKSTASGILQFIDGTFAWVWHEHYGDTTPVDWTRKNDPFLQIKFGKWLYDRYGLSQWEYPCGTLNA